MTRVRWSSEWVMAGLALIFLAGYAWPILDPDLGSSGRTLSSVCVWATWAAFGVHYLVNLVQAPHRRAWFGSHLLDLALLVVPVLRPLRLLRLVTLIQVLNRSAASSFRGRVGVYVSVGAALLAFVSALAVLDAERRSSEANIESFGDAIWWACATMTTVGYGDQFPVTGTGRVVGVGLMIAGIALLGTVTATLASWFVQAVSSEAVGAMEDFQDQQEQQDLDLTRELVALRKQVAVLAERLDPDASS